MLDHKFIEKWFEKYILDQEPHMNSFEFLQQICVNIGGTLQTRRLIGQPSPFTRLNKI